MITFHYLICNVPKKERYHVMKLIFMNNKLENNNELYVTTNQLNNLKKSLEISEYSVVEDSVINLDSFIKHFNLFK